VRLHGGAPGRESGHAGRVKPHRERPVLCHGKLAGAVWRPPYESISRSWCIRVKTSCACGSEPGNQRNGRQSQPITAADLRFGERFKPQDMNNLQPLPSGLNGNRSLLSDSKTTWLPRFSGRFGAGPRSPSAQRFEVGILRDISPKRRTDGNTLRFHDLAALENLVLRGAPITRVGLVSSRWSSRLGDIF